MKKLATKYIIITCIINLYTFSPVYGSSPTESSFDKEVYSWSRTFAEILQLTNKKHYKQNINPEDCFKKALAGFVQELDPHSSFLPPETYAKMLSQTSGSFPGIGIILGAQKIDEKSILIINTIPNGPADTAGVQALDKIIEIEGELVSDMALDQAISKLRGERNSKVTIKIIRDDHPDLLTFVITRDEIKEQSSLSFYLPEYNVYYASLTSFTQNSSSQLDSILQKVKNNPCKALILDLRSNTGGLFSVAIDIASLFLKKNSLVTTTKGKNNQIFAQSYTQKDPTISADLPVFILINNYTASSAEILAGSLQAYSKKLNQEFTTEKNCVDNLLIFLVGTKSYGKASVQEVIPISNNSAIKITSALYYLPGDILIQGKGLEPDFSVPPLMPISEKIQWFTDHHGREENLKGHINTTGKKKDSQKNPKKDSQKNWHERIQEMLNKDHQFKSTLRMANLLSFAKKNCSGSVQSRSMIVNFLKNSLVITPSLTFEEVILK